MKYITLQEIIDDILLLVRNNNISESEDLSRALIKLWVKAYRRLIWKERKDALKLLMKQMKLSSLDAVLDAIDEEFFYIKETEHELEPVELRDGSFSYTRRTKDTLEGLMDDARSSVLAVHDADGENIQLMNHIRRHYHNNRKYTFGELTAYYMPNDKHVYVQGLQDEGVLQYVFVLGLYEKDEEGDGGNGDEDDNDIDEKDVKIPTWMVPGIKERMLKNELAFMLNRPSDDSNNSTLASVKPNGPQDQEK